MWTIEYRNEDWLIGEGYEEWYEVNFDNRVIVKCEDKETADWLCKFLNEHAAKPE